MANTTQPYVTSNISTWLDTSNSNELNKFDFNKIQNIYDVALYRNSWNVEDFILNHVRLKINGYDINYLKELIVALNLPDNDKLWYAISKCELDDEILLKYFNQLYKYENTWKELNRYYSHDVLKELVGEIESKCEELIIETIIINQENLPAIFLDIFDYKKSTISKAVSLTEKYYLSHYDKFDHEIVNIYHGWKY